jgi:serine protease
MKKATYLLLVLLVSSASFAGQPAQNKKSSAVYFKMRDGIQQDEYLPNTIVFKMKAQYRSNCNQRTITNLLSLNLFFTSLNASVKKMFPEETGLVQTRNKSGQQYTDLSLIYTLTYNNGKELTKAINELYALGYVEYAEPHYIPKAFFTPNDAQLASQYHLDKINAYNAWDVNQGDSAVIIGIVDTGTDPLHEDLKNNIKYNFADPVNGADDDNDGYVDNFAGWDVAMNDSDATWQGNPHGIHVSGCASASTNNNLGVAGSGFKCKFLPVKIANASGALTAAYEGVKYAADHGCQIINCSWGGTDGGQLGLDIINYATINKNALVVAAAGNNNKNEAFYPAAYPYSLSVASTTSTDDKSNFSNYNYTVDVCAPGSAIYATFTNNGYANSSGTSMASPIAAGAAAVIKAKYPTYNALQIGQVLKETADNIYAVGSNSSYSNCLGGGRINMLRSLTDVVKSISMINLKIKDNDDIYMPEDTIAISGDFINYFGSSSAGTSAVLTAITNTSAVTIVNNTFAIGTLNEMESKNSDASPFKVKISSPVAPNTVVDFKVSITDGAYISTVFFAIVINPDYVNVTVNDIRTTVTSKGRIGYNKDGQLQGLGFDYNDNALLYEASLLVGASATLVSDMFRGDSKKGGDEDNNVLSRAQRVVTKAISDFDVDCSFNDNGAPAPIGIKTHHQAFAWSSAGNRKFIIHKFTLVNTTASALSNIYAGLIADWDIMNSAKNKGATDNTLRLGYTYSTETNGLYAGVKLLTTAPFLTYAIDNINGGGGGVDIVGGSPEFNTDEKYTVLSTSRAEAGAATAEGNDIIQSVSSGPLTINSGDSVVVAFAMLAGDNLTDLQNSAKNAQIKYDGTVGIDDFIANADDFSFNCYPNPAGKNMLISFKLPITCAVDIKVYNALGQETSVSSKKVMQAGAYSYELDLSALSSGVYYCQLKAGANSTTKKILIN